MRLDEIVTDVMLLARGMKLTQSETIQRPQVIYWINAYRAILFKQSMDKNNEIDRAYIQSLNCMSLSQIDKSECTAIVNTNRILLRTAEIPKPIITRKGNCFTFIGDIHGKPYQLTTEDNIYFNLKRKYSGRDIYAYYKDTRIYIVSPQNPNLKYITIRGVFEDPTLLANYTDNCTKMATFTLESDYPISMNVIPIIKDMIISREIKVGIGMYSDNDNDANAKYSPNTKQ